MRASSICHWISTISHSSSRHWVYVSLCTSIYGSQRTAGKLWKTGTAGLYRRTPYASHKTHLRKTARSARSPITQGINKSSMIQFTVSSTEKYFKEIGPI